ncbi:MAG: DUF177 domain-containing protein [Acetobacteraceae bacterium]|nr:DUF177 domain-containing protein [Acetobacteraceae bacterium]
MTPEFSRPVATDRIGPEGLSVVVEAKEAERIALARRLGLPAVQALSCHFDLRRLPGETVAAAGYLTARLVQVCVVSLDEFDAAVEERFLIHFVPEGRESDDPDPESPDEIPYSRGVIDLGEAAAEQLALALDPYPRRPDAAMAEQDDTTATHPFAALAAFRSH